MPHGVIIKALSGFYYVHSDEKTVECKARGRFRHEELVPLVGDEVSISLVGDKGVVEEIAPRRNSFKRPAVANIDYLVIIASTAIPVADPFLIDQLSTAAELSDCGVIICINKSDLSWGEKLFEIYSKTGYHVVRVSAETGYGIEEMHSLIRGKTCAFTGDSGVGKSSILNRLDPNFNIRVGEVSKKLGRGRHTTRHVELFALGNDTFIADTPGFASFETGTTQIRRENLQYAFPEFAPFLGKCRFNDCAHLREPDCAVVGAVESGVIHPSRHASYVKLYEIAAQIKDWDSKQQ